MSAKTWVTLVLAGALVAACKGAAAEHTESATENATAAESPDVARARHAFEQGKVLAGASNADVEETLQISSTSATGMRVTWTCSRLDAAQGVAPAPSDASYSFSTTGGGEYANASSSFGAHWLAEGAELVGTAADFVPGSIGRAITVRGTDTGIVFEEILRPTVAKLDPTDQATWDADAEKYQGSVSGNGLTTAYTTCTATNASHDGAPTVFFDDFTDNAFSSVSWDPLQYIDEPLFGEAASFFHRTIETRAPYRAAHLHLTLPTNSIELELGVATIAIDKTKSQVEIVAGLAANAQTVAIPSGGFDLSIEMQPSGLVVDVGGDILTFAGALSAQSSSKFGLVYAIADTRLASIALDPL